MSTPTNGYVLPVRYTTTCKLCGRRIAEMPALEIPIIGHPGKRAEELMRILYKHLTKHHAQDFENGARLAQELPPFLILTAFEHEDPTMNPRLENIRAAIFQIVRKNSMTDANLQYIVSGLGLDQQDEGKVLAAMIAVRDACCEMGKYAPTAPAVSLKP